MSKGDLLSIKSRVRSVETILSISKSLEALSSSKYVKLKREIGNVEEMKLAANEYIRHIPIDNKVGKSLTVVVASDRSLCAGYNSNILKRVDLSENIIAVGKRVESYLNKRGREYFKLDIDRVVRDIISGEVSELFILYTNRGSVVKERVFPWLCKSEINSNLDDEELFKQSLRVYLPLILRANLALAELSEHFIRMNAMKSTYDNSKELIDQLKIRHNKERQSLLTRDILEVVGGTIDE